MVIKRNLWSCAILFNFRFALALSEHGLKMPILTTTLFGATYSNFSLPRFLYDTVFDDLFQMVACFDTVEQCSAINNLSLASALQLSKSYIWGMQWVLYSYPGPRQGEGSNVPGRHFWWKEGIANGLSRMNPKLDLGFRFCLRLDLPYVWPGLSRFKRLSRPG